MKTVLVVAAALGLSASAALADCSWHNKSAEAKVDKTITTASVATTPSAASTPSHNQAPRRTSPTAARMLAPSGPRPSPSAGRTSSCP